MKKILKYFSKLENESKLTDDYSHNSLGPNHDIKDIWVYEDTLIDQFEDELVYNISLMGSYGAGKSSIIKTFFKRNSKYIPIYISLGSYSSQLKEETEKFKKMPIEFERFANELNQSIELSILQQLIYVIDPKKLPRSSFKRIIPINKIKIIVITASLLLTLYSIIRIFNDSLLNKVSKYMENTIQLGNYFRFFVTIIVPSLFVAYSIYRLLLLLFSSVNISKVKIKDAEIEVDGKKESLFNKYLDEILYFFQQTKYNVVVIEDLDRLDNSVYILTKLRELNTLINNTTTVKKKVVFVYSISDTVFDNYEIRTKFFDYIIPVIPNVSYSNSKEYLWERLNKRHLIDDSITKESIKDISAFVTDARTLKNIVNEFEIYKRKIDIKVSGINLISMMIYKNYFPEKYDNLRMKKGELFTFIQNKEKIVKELITEIKMKIHEIEFEQNSILNEHLSSSRELKTLFLGNYYNERNRNIIQFELDNSDMVSVDDFMSDDVKFESVTRIKDSNYSVFEIRNAFETEEIYNNYLNRSNLLSEGLEERKNKNLESIKSLNSQILELGSRRISELLSYGVPSDNTESLIDFELFMLRRGYIDENYYWYINSFTEGELSLLDRDYIVATRYQKSLGFNYRLNEVYAVIQEIDIRDLTSPNYLNICLIHEMFMSSKVYSEKYTKTLEILNKFAKETSELLYLYLIDVIDSNESDDLTTIANEIFISCSDLLKYTLEHYKTDTYYIGLVLRLFVVNFDNYHLIDYSNNLVDFTAKLKEVDFLIDGLDSRVVKNKLKKLNVQFEKLDLNRTNYASIIINEMMFAPNWYMLNQYNKYRRQDIDTQTKGFISTSFEKDKKLYFYLIENLDKFLDEDFTHLNEVSESEEVVASILKSNIIDETKIKLINKLNFKLISVIESSVHTIECLINNNKLVLSWENIKYIIGIIESVDQFRIFQSVGDLLEYYLEANHYIFEDGLISLEGNPILVDYFYKNTTLTEKTITHVIDSIEFVIDNLEEYTLDYDMSKERILTLVENGKVSYSAKNYEYLLSKNLYKEIALISVNNVDKLMEATLDEDLQPEIVEEMIKLENVAKKDIIRLICSIGNVSDSDILTLYFIKHYDASEISNYTAELRELIFRNDENEMKIIESLLCLDDDSVNLSKYISIIGKNILKDLADDSKFYVRIVENEVNIKFAKFLVNNKIISSFRTDRSKIVLNKFRKKRVDY